MTSLNRFNKKVDFINKRFEKDIEKLRKKYFGKHGHVLKLTEALQKVPIEKQSIGQDALNRLIVIFHRHL